MDVSTSLGIETNGKHSRTGDGPSADRAERIRQLNLVLAAGGVPPVAVNGMADRPFLNSAAAGLLDSYREQSRRLLDHRCPADLRIETFLQSHLADLGLEWAPRLPAETLVLSRHGVARELSLPADGDEFHSPLLASYRAHNGVLHNPKNDKRTTAGTFHVAEGGLPIPGDKKAVPKRIF